MHPLHEWHDILTTAACSTRWFHRVHVLRETNSTQDAARRLHARPGEIVVAARQTAGRGRLGRAWADTAELGVACTFVVREDRPERLAATSVIGAAFAVECLLGRRVTVKWPNDLYVDRSKLAGILIERSNDIAWVGIGVNVSHRAFTGELATKATSLAILGVEADRVDVMAALIRSFSAAIDMNDELLAAEFDRRCALRGQEVALKVGEIEHYGRVRRVSPICGLELETSQGLVHLPAASTTVLRVNSSDSGYDCADRRQSP